MQHIDSAHSPGTVIVPAASLARYAEFWLAIESLNVPRGTRLVAARGADIPHQLNEGVRRLVGQWAWFLGDDHTFEPDCLLKLLDRQVDAVVPVVPRRDPPFGPVFLHGPLSDSMRAYSWEELPASGLFEVPESDFGGQAGMLVRKPILDKIGDPWFEGGKLTPGRLMEDMYFMVRLHELGVPIYIDCDVAMGHIANIDIQPIRHGGAWWPSMKTKHGPLLLDRPGTVNPEAMGLIRRIEKAPT